MTGADIVTNGQATITLIYSEGVSRWIVLSVQDDAATTSPTVPDPTVPVPISYRGETLYVHPTDNSAASTNADAIALCDGLTAHGFSDWVLPDREQLDAVYKQSYLLDGIVNSATGLYWSSTAFDGSNSYALRFYDGAPDIDPISTNHNVRCIRQD
jgi:hypothetical protein